MQSNFTHLLITCKHAIYFPVLIFCQLLWCGIRLHHISVTVGQQSICSPYHTMAIAAIPLLSRYFTVIMVAILYMLPDGGSPTPIYGAGGGYKPTPTLTPTYGTTPTPSYGTTPSTPSTPSRDVPEIPKQHEFIGSCE